MIAIIQEIFGSWAWVIFGLVLLGIEIMIPSSFLLWPGIAALIVGVFTLILGMDSFIWPWQAQVLVFLVLSVLSAWIGRRYIKRNKLDESEVPHLNDTGAQLVGQMAVVVDEIVDGHGRVKIGDTTWRVNGDDVKAGGKVRVVSAGATSLTVEKI